MALEDDDLAINREDRCPLVLVLDVSSSMTLEDRIGELNRGLQQLRSELTEDELTSQRVELAVVTFGSTAQVHQPFGGVSDFEPPHLVADGTTAMGSAMDLAHELVEARKRGYDESGVGYYRPWIWLMSDGAPNDQGWEQAATRSSDAARRKKAKIFAVGIGERARLDILEKFTGGTQALRLQPGRFREMFAWLSTSITAVSQSIPKADPDGDGAVPTNAAGVETALENPTTGPRGWATA